MAEAASVLVDLSPKNTGTVAKNANGITPSNVWGYELDAWHGTYEKSDLAGQVAFTADGALNLQIGAVASQNVGGNFAGLKFSLAPEAASPVMSFDIAKSGSWGGSLASFNCTYTCNIYGFAQDGVATVIGTWTLANAKDSLTADK